MSSYRKGLCLFGWILPKLGECLITAHEEVKARIVLILAVPSPQGIYAKKYFVTNISADHFTHLSYAFANVNNKTGEVYAQHAR